jgi:hypothetical protein
VIDALRAPAARGQCCTLPPDAVAALVAEVDRLRAAGGRTIAVGVDLADARPLSSYPAGGEVWPEIEPAGFVATIAFDGRGEPEAVEIKGVGPMPDWLRMVVDAVERRRKAPWTTGQGPADLGSPGAAITVDDTGRVVAVDLAADTWRDRPPLL